MLDTKRASKAEKGKDDSCQVRIWSKECEHSTYEYIGDKFRCDVCESVQELNHEVRPATMPYVSGDYDNLY